MDERRDEMMHENGGDRGSGMREQLGQAGRRAERAAGGASTRAGDAISRGAERMEEGSRSISGAMSRSAEYLRESDVRSMGRDLTRVLRDHPKMSIAVGVGVGFLLGRMLTRR